MYSRTGWLKRKTVAVKSCTMTPGCWWTVFCYYSSRETGKVCLGVAVAGAGSAAPSPLFTEAAKRGKAQSSPGHPRGFRRGHRGVGAGRGDTRVRNSKSRQWEERRGSGRGGEKEQGAEQRRGAPSPCPPVPLSKRRLAVPYPPPRAEAVLRSWRLREEAGRRLLSFPARGDPSVGAGGELGPGLAVLPARLRSDFFHPERCPGEARRGCRCREKQDGGGCHPASPEPPASSRGSLLPASCGRGSCPRRRSNFRGQ